MGTIIAPEIHNKRVPTTGRVTLGKNLPFRKSGRMISCVLLRNSTIDCLVSWNASEYDIKTH
jgi:hypothetical protein